MVRRNAASVFQDCAFACIVSGQRELNVSVESVEQEAHVTCAAFDVLLRIENVCDAETRSRAGHELHQAARALRRDRATLERRLRVHLRVNQYGIESVADA